MKTFIFAAALFFICHNCFASTYAVSKPDGSISIVYYNDGSSKSIDKVMNDLGFGGLPYSELSSIPESRTDRKFWILKNGNIEIDHVKKQAQTDANLLEQAKKEAVLSKLKITKEEFGTIANVE